MTNINIITSHDIIIDQQSLVCKKWHSQTHRNRISVVVVVMATDHIDVRSRHAVAIFSVWLPLYAFVILAFNICYLDGNFQGQKLKISLSLTWAIEKLYECTTH